MSLAATQTEHTGAASHAARQYLTFTLGEETFAVEIEQVREIIEFNGLTGVPLMPDFVRGVINLRGAVVPVVDLQARFGKGVSQISRRTCIVIVEDERDEGLPRLGMMVDGVSEVVMLDAAANTDNRPPFGTDIRTDFISSILDLDEHFVIALDLRRVLSIEEIATLAGLGAGERRAAG